MAQGSRSLPQTLPVFQMSTLSKDEKLEAAFVLNYLLGHAHHIANENGCVFQGHIACIHGTEILIYFKVDFLSTPEFPKTEDYAKTVRLNLCGDYHSQLINHIIRAILYVIPCRQNTYIKHTYCNFTNDTWVHQYHLWSSQGPTSFVCHRQDVPR